MGSRQPVRKRKKGGTILKVAERNHHERNLPAEKLSLHITLFNKTIEWAGMIYSAIIYS